MISKTFVSTQNLFDVVEVFVPRISRQWENLIWWPLYLVNPLSNESLIVLKLNLKQHQQANEQKENGKQTQLYNQLAGLLNTFQ